MQLVCAVLSSACIPAHGIAGGSLAVAVGLALGSWRLRHRDDSLTASQLTHPPQQTVWYSHGACEWDRLLAMFFPIHLAD